MNFGIYYDQHKMVYERVNAFPAAFLATLPKPGEDFHLLSLPKYGY